MDIGPPGDLDLTHLFAISRTDIALLHGASCDHGDNVFLLLAEGHYRDASPDTRETVPLALPHCRAAEVFGLILGILTAESATTGSTAVKDFLGTAARIRDSYLDEVRRLRDSNRDCCPAAFHTGGREHTCRNHPEGRTK